MYFYLKSSFLIKGLVLCLALGIITLSQPKAAWEAMAATVPILSPSPSAGSNLNTSPSSSPSPSVSPSPSTSVRSNASSSMVGGLRMNLILTEPEKSQANLFFELIPLFLKKHSPDSLGLEYIPGTGGAKAWHTLQKRAGDGSQIAAVVLPNYLLKPLVGERRFSPEKSKLFCTLAEIPLGLWVEEKSSIQNLSQLIDHFKSQEDEIFYLSGVGSYSSHHMATLFLNRAAGINAEYLPYLGSAESTKACSKKYALAAWGAATPQKNMPGMRLIAIAAEQRSSIYPDLPTFNEANIDMQIKEQYGMALPADSPEEIIKTASELFTHIAKNQDFAEEAHKLGYEIKVLPYEMMEDFLNEQNKGLKTFLYYYTMP